MAGWSLFSWLRQLFHLTFCLCLQGSSRYLEENQRMQINIAQKWTKRHTVCAFDHARMRAMPLCTLSTALWLPVYFHENCDPANHTAGASGNAWCTFSCWWNHLCTGSCLGGQVWQTRSEILSPTMINTHVLCSWLDNGNEIMVMFLINVQKVWTKWWTKMSRMRRQVHSKCRDMWKQFTRYRCWRCGR